jgi:hypothetical protein
MSQKLNRGEPQVKRRCTKIFDDNAKCFGGTIYAEWGTEQPIGVC